MWHMCTLHEQPQRTDQNFMQDKLTERSVLGLYEHGTVVSTTPTFSRQGTRSEDTRLYINSPGPLPHQECCARGRPHTVDLAPHQRGRELEGGPEEEGQIKGDINVLGVCE